MPEEIPDRFIVHIEGQDVPGLVYAIAHKLYQEGYNISDISLSTGASTEEQLHTTFLMCERQTLAPKGKRVSPESRGGGNKWKEMLEIEEILADALREVFKAYYEARQLVKFAAPPVKVSCAQIPEPGAFQVYMEIVFADQLGALANLTDLLRDVFTINDAFDRPERDAGAKSGKKQAKTRALYMRLSRITDLEPDAAKSRPNQENSINRQLIEKLGKAARQLYTSASKGSSRSIRKVKAVKLANAIKDGMDQWHDIQPDRNGINEPKVLRNRFHAKIRVGHVIVGERIVHDFSEDLPGTKKEGRVSAS